MAEYRRGRGPHFAPIPFELLEDPEADAYTIAVYAAIKSYADFGSDEGARQGDGKACKRAGCSERIFRDRRERLRRMGWLEWEQRPGRTNVYVVHSSPATPAPHAGVQEDGPGATCRGTPAAPAAPPRHQVPTTKSHIPKEVATTTPLNPPGESQPTEGEADSPAPGAVPERTAPTGEATGDSAPTAPAPLSAELEAAISQVIQAANRAMTAHPGIDQTRLRPIPTIGAGRQAVWDWIAEGIPIPLILEVVRKAVREYQPDGHRTQISSMSYFAARVREANELRLAREAGANEQRNGRAGGDGLGGVQAARRRSAGRVSETQGGRKVSKYDAVTIRS